MFWTVSWDRLVEYERDDLCVHYTLQRMKGKASRVMRIILEMSARDLYAKEAEDDLLSVPALFTARHGREEQERTYPSRLDRVSVISDVRGTTKFVPLLKIFNEYQKQFIHNKPISSLNSSHSAINAASGTSTNSSSTSASDAYIKTEPMHRVQTLDLTTLRQLLDHLTQDGSLSCKADSSGSVSSQGQSSNKYSVRTSHIIKTLRRKSIHNIAKDRYGAHGARIVELFLSTNEWLEQGIIADTAIIPARETREKLYLLYRDKWIDFKEVSRRGDFSYINTTYFWHVEYKQALNVVLEHCFQAMYNLRIKRNNILQQASTLDSGDLEQQAIDLFVEASNGTYMGH